MRVLIFFFVLIQSAYSFAQIDSVIFNNNFKFKEGIYTSYLQILNNEPQFLKAKIFIEYSSNSKHSRAFYYSEVGEKQFIDDSLNYVLAIANGDGLFIKYKNRYYKPILYGAISIFLIQTIFDPNSIHAKSGDQMYIYDLKSGIISYYNYNNLDSIFQRDIILYSDFSSIPKSKATNQLYSYVLKYNSRNPIYIKLYNIY
jgi:hypothetical protein